MTKNRANPFKINKKYNVLIFPYQFIDERFEKKTAEKYIDATEIRKNLSVFAGRGRGCRRKLFTRVGCEYRRKTLECPYLSS